IRSVAWTTESGSSALRECRQPECQEPSGTPQPSVHRRNDSSQSLDHRMRLCISRAQAMAGIRVQSKGGESPLKIPPPPIRPTRIEVLTKALRNCFRVQPWRLTTLHRLMYAQQ